MTERAPFRFEGTIPASKSVMIRWLITASYGGALTIDGDSNCDDVRIAKAALVALRAGQPIEVGDGAFGFRALVARASRLPGTHVFQLGHRLAERPHRPLLEMLADLAVDVAVDGTVWRVSSRGWQLPKAPLFVDGSFSSQFASALAVNGWDLPAPLVFHAPSPVSGGYFALTRRQLGSVGLTVEPLGDDRWRLPAGVAVPVASVAAEPDMSSAFAVAALAAVAGEAHLQGLGAAVLEQSEQPDRCFPELLRRYGAAVTVGTEGLRVRRADAPTAFDVDLRGAPDLFPVLAALLAVAPGRSRLFGAPQLRAKESDRIAAVAALLRGVGIASEPQDDGLVVYGQRPVAAGEAFLFDPGRDHRLVMAAAVLKRAGLSIEIAGTAVVAKSFPEFAPLI